MAELPGVALITGAGSGKSSPPLHTLTPVHPPEQPWLNLTPGIGQAVALAFLRAGCTNLTLIDMSTPGLQKTQSLLTEINSSANITLETGNTTDASFIDRAVENLLTKHGRLDYAVNCAGVMGPYLSTIDDSIESLDHVMNVNYKGTLLCSRAEIRAMLRNEPSGAEDIPGQRGAIVHIASAYGLFGAPRVTSYCASKGAILQLTRADAVDYSPRGIRINAVCPGLISTPATFDPDKAETMKPFEEIIGKHPMGRWGRASEVADACVFLCSGKASFVQGVALPVDGGWSAAG
ncbi:hypothetical protein PMZ80_008460 [Knufia obscura]|uniref:NAD(P)-binding protein n=1 Tax=Knufia obscura TaxID=1635080 RepID=A0ABR0RFV3_9EURO|nr:hypothetical protein PMZ80_008460 [Knufia obscura]